jgi:hypothetical protein
LVAPYVYRLDELQEQLPANRKRNKERTIMAAATKPEQNFNRGQEHITEAGKQAMEAGRQASDKAKDVASAVAGKAKDMASAVGHSAEDATHALGSGMQSLGGTIREHSPQSGILGAAGTTVASNLESGGRYLQKEGLSGIAEDMTDLIRRNPVPAMLIGIGLGFILARATVRT